MKNVLEHTSPALIVEDCSIQMILNMEILEQDFVRTAHRIIKRILFNTNRQYSMVGIFFTHKTTILEEKGRIRLCQTQNCLI